MIFVRFTAERRERIRPRIRVGRNVHHALELLALRDFFGCPLAKVVNTAAHTRTASYLAKTCRRDFM